MSSVDVKLRLFVRLGGTRADSGSPAAMGAVVGVDAAIPFEHGARDVVANLVPARRQHDGLTQRVPEVGGSRNDGRADLAVMLDLYSRRVVGWATSARLQTDLALGALHMAVGRRQPPRGVIHHSDRGLQYASATYQHTLRRHGFRVSMSRRGDLLGQRRR